MMQNMEWIERKKIGDTLFLSRNKRHRGAVSQRGRDRARRIPSRWTRTTSIRRSSGDSAAKNRFVWQRNSKLWPCRGPDPAGLYFGVRLRRELAAVQGAFLSSKGDAAVSVKSPPSLPSPRLSGLLTPRLDTRFPGEKIDGAGRAENLPRARSSGEKVRTIPLTLSR